MLRDRVITAAVAIAILVPIFLLGGLEGVVFLVALFGGAALWELATCLPGLKTSPGKQLTLAVGLATAIAFYLVPPGALTAVLAWFPLLVVVLHLALYHRIERSVESASQMIFAVSYVMVPLSHATLVRQLEMGVSWIFLIMVVICLGDAGAYFAGKRFGKHRFSSSVSPSKTIEGLGGGVVGNILGMLIVKLCCPDLPPIATLLWLTLLLAIVGPVGDLCASMLKRRLEIKDFGSIMPGHGGVMDRADSLIFAFPAAYYFLVLVGQTIGK